MTGTQETTDVFQHLMTNLRHYVNDCGNGGYYDLPLMVHCPGRRKMLIREISRVW